MYIYILHVYHTLIILIPFIIFCWLIHKYIYIYIWYSHFTHILIYIYIWCVYIYITCKQHVTYVVRICRALLGHSCFNIPRPTPGLPGVGQPHDRPSAGRQHLQPQGHCHVPWLPRRLICGCFLKMDGLYHGIFRDFIGFHKWG